MFFTHNVLFVFTAWFSGYARNIVHTIRERSGSRGPDLLFLDRSFFGIRSGIGSVDSLVWDEYIFIRVFFCDQSVLGLKRR